MKTVFLLFVTALAVSACSSNWLDLDSDPFDFSGSDAKGEAKPVIPAPPGKGPNDKTSNDLISEPMGLNLETYFAEKVSDPDKRMDRIEKALISLQKEMRGSGAIPVAPVGRQVLSSAPAALHPSDMGGVTSAPQNLQRQNIAAYTPPPAPAPAPASVSPPPSPAVSPPPPAPQNYNSAAGNPVQQGARPASDFTGGDVYGAGLRVGEHPDKVRLVIDTSKPISYTADLDNDEHILVVDLPGASWRGPMNESFGRESIVSSYQIDPLEAGKGSRIIVQLKGQSAILNQTTMPALSGGGQRIVIDLRK